jgi:ATP-dependent DNA ligase
MDDRHFLALGKAIYTFQRLELADQRTIRTADGTATHQATATTGAEGTVSKRRDSPYMGGRSRHWRKANHSVQLISGRNPKLVPGRNNNRAGQFLRASQW